MRCGFYRAVFTGLPVACMISSIGMADRPPSTQDVENMRGLIEAYDEGLTPDSASARTRHEIALDYALNNQTFREKVDSFALKHAVKSGAEGALSKGIIAAVFETADAMKLAQKGSLEGWSTDFGLALTSRISRTLLMYSGGLAARALVSPMEIAAAFTTAYTYGYFFSPEAKALRASGGGSW